jgi:ERCC4-type nuclease
MLLDSREDGLHELLPTVPLKTLPCADVWIGLSGEEIATNGLLIERKSVWDLEASILDNRYREQRSRIMAYARERQAHPLYVIEGPLDKTQRLGKSALVKHLTRLSLRYHIPFFQTRNLQDTAQLLQFLEEQWTADPTTFAQPKEMTYIETRGKSRVENSDDPAVFAASVLMCCRGISTTGAQAILAAFGGSLDSVWKATEAQLAAVQVGKQRLGPAKAKKLHSLLHQMPLQTPQISQDITG